MKYSEQKLKELLTSAEKQNDEKGILITLKLLADFYEENSNYKESLKIYKQFHDFELHFTNRELEEKKKDLLDSIRYAYRIQTAISPPDYLVSVHKVKQKAIFFVSAINMKNNNVTIFTLFRLIIN